MAARAAVDRLWHAHLFTLLAYNLIERCYSVSQVRCYVCVVFFLKFNSWLYLSFIAQISYGHIELSDGCLSITVPKLKSDQAGAAAVPKRVFANPSDPTLCPITALGLHVICSAYMGREANQLLFQGAFASRFSKFLRDFLSEASVVDLESDPRDLGKYDHGNQ
jgi:hypothetical protein